VKWCARCGRLQRATCADRRYVVRGLPSIVLHGVPVVTCPTCGRSDDGIAQVDDLHHAIAHAIILKRQRLLPGEIRFLRKQLRLPALELAARLGVTPESVSRWENGWTPMGVTPDRLLRLMVAVAQGAQFHLAALRSVACLHPRANAIHLRWDDGKWTESVEDA